MKEYKPIRLKVIDWNTWWFWLLVYYQPYAYGEPWLLIEIFEPEKIKTINGRFKRTWFHFWKWIPTGDQENTNSY